MDDPATSPKNLTIPHPSGKRTGRLRDTSRRPVFLQGNKSSSSIPTNLVQTMGRSRLSRQNRPLEHGPQSLARMADPEFQTPSMTIIPLRGPAFRSRGLDRFPQTVVARSEEALISAQSCRLQHGGPTYFSPVIAASLLLHWVLLLRAERPLAQKLVSHGAHF